MTTLVKPLRRQTTWRAPHGVAPKVVITLYPGGQIGLREMGRRKEITVDAATLYARALADEHRQRRRA
jgi:hypothetical protein